MPSIVYAKNSKLPRRVVVDAVVKVGLAPGEDVLHVDNLPSFDMEALRRRVAVCLGVDIATIPSGRCALVDKTSGEVVAAIMADPDLDTHPVGPIIASDAAQIGWKWDGAQFQRRYVVVQDNKVVDLVWATDAGAKELQNATADDLAQIGDRYGFVGNVESQGTKQI